MASSVNKVEPIYKAWVIREPRHCQLSVHSQEQIPLVGLLDLASKVVTEMPES